VHHRAGKASYSYLLHPADGPVKLIKVIHQTARGAGEVSAGKTNLKDGQIVLHIAFTFLIFAKIHKTLLQQFCILVLYF
jgi:hypothetical protein